MAHETDEVFDMSNTTQDGYTHRYARRSGVRTSEIRALFAAANRPEGCPSPYVAAVSLRSGRQVADALRGAGLWVTLPDADAALLTGAALPSGRTPW